MEKVHRLAFNIFRNADGQGYGNLLTDTQLMIADTIVTRRYPRTQLILPTQYGKSLVVALATLLRASLFAEQWAIIAPTEAKARIIMNYIIEHIFDVPTITKLLDYEGTKEQLMQERSKSRITFRGAGEVRIYTADAKNSQNVKKALMGFGSPNIILDESALIPDDLYSTIKRMLGGTKDNFLLEIGNPFFRNHFWRTWNGERYTRIFADYHTALSEGRYTEDFIEEMREEAFFDVLYECHFPDNDSAVPDGYQQLISYAVLENAMIDKDLPLGHDDNGLIDKPILGIDPNHGGSNFTVMVVRYPLTGFAKVVLKKQYKEDRRDITGEIVADAINIMKQYGISEYRCAVDAGNGGGVADGLQAKGFSVVPIMFGEAAEDNLKYANKKAELFWNARKWLRSDNGRLVKDDGFLELKIINYKETTSGKLQMEPKADLSKRGIVSPDTADAFALTFITTSDIVEDDDDVDYI